MLQLSQLCFLHAVTLRGKVIQAGADDPYGDTGPERNDACTTVLDSVSIEPESEEFEVAGSTAGEDSDSIGVGEVGDGLEFFFT